MNELLIGIWVMQFISIILHLDEYLGLAIQDYGFYIYALLFLIIFCETGLVFTPFLPGDSLLFAAGAFAALGSLKVWGLFVLLLIAAFLGDTANYWMGNYFGMKLFKKESRFLKQEYLDKTHQFYEKHGKKTIILARFVPIVRTFAPFVAGMGKMSYLTFLSYNIIGGFFWVTILLFGGYYFGQIPIVKNNFSIVILTIIIISFVPMFIEYVKYLIKTKKKKSI